MKKITCLFLLISLTLAGFSQIKLDYTAKPKTQSTGFTVQGLTAESAYLVALLRQVDDPVCTPAERKAALDQIRNHHAVSAGQISATLSLAAGHDMQELSNYGVIVNSEAGGILTTRIPVGRFVELAASVICRKIDVGSRIQPMLDKARTNLGIDMIYSGLHLPQGYDGTGVVVGIIDHGFEFTHPSFYDTTGNVLRVKRVWNQQDSTGTAPGGFTYGSEYITESQMALAKTDDSSNIHGTHVAGIAAGCGAPSGDGMAYRGMAPGADIVLVSYQPNETNVLDAIRYIHEYARSVDKPCVINMSFGSMICAHDGTDMQDVFLTSYIAQHSDSLALVASAGNSGDSHDHIEKQFTPTDTTFITYLDCFSLMDFEGELGLWNDRNFSFAITMVNTATMEQEDFTGFFSTGTDSLIETSLVTSDNSEINLKITLFGEDSLNHRYHANMLFTNSIPYQRKLFLTVRCDTTAHFHGWANDFTFEESDLVSEAVGGDSHYTIAGYGANTDAVISVGAYTTRVEYDTYNGYHYGNSSNEIGKLASFSSLGPTFDGRVKPDITAPGVLVVSPYNRFATQAIFTTVYDTIVWNGETEQYGIESGTSMSSPMVAGIVALWMQHNRALGTDSLRSILHQTARNDRFTGSATTNPNNSWGYGKINAFGGLPATNTPLWLMNVVSCDNSMGTVSDGGLVEEGNYTITATPRSSYVFERWDDGNTTNPRVVHVDCDTTFEAVFILDCQTISDFPWTAEFDANLTCWGVIDADGNGQMWTGGATSVVSMGSTNTDNWLISPVIDLNRPLMASVGARSTIVPGASQDLSLLISTTGTEMEDFTTTLATFNSQTIETFNLTASLREYQGEQVHLALRHHNCTGTLGLVSLVSFVIEDDTTVSVPNYTLPNFTIATNGLQFTVNGAEGLPLQVFDIMGRLVVNTSSANGTYQVPAPGVYIVRVAGLKPRKLLFVR